MICNYNVNDDSQLAETVADPGEGKNFLGDHPSPLISRSGVFLFTLYNVIMKIKWFL